MRAPRFLILAALFAGVPGPCGAALPERDGPILVAAHGAIVDVPGGSGEMEVVRFSEPAAAALLGTSIGDSLRLEDWPVAPGVRRPVVLSRFEVYAPDTRIVRIVDGQEIELPRSPLVFFKGTTADGDEPARVVAWVDPVLGVRGGFVFGVDGMVEIDPDPDPNAGKSLRVLNAEARFAEGDDRRPTFTCAQGEGETAHFSVPDTRGTLGEAYRAVVPTDLAPLATTPTKTAVIAFDTDAEWIALRHVGSIPYTINHLAQLVALMTIIYERDAGPAKDQGVRILQGYSIIRATEAEDPYPDTTGVASETKLNDLTSHWETNHPRSVVKRALVALISGKQSNVRVTSASGIAWVGGLCNGFGYSVNQLMTGLSSDLWDMLIMAHEVGHNFGSPHTHCYPAPRPDTCNGSENGTNCFSGTGSCPGSATYNGVTTNGTLMSYCHAISCNPRNDNVFHPTSVSSYLLPNIIAASCLATVPGVVPSGPNSIAIGPTFGPLAGGQSVTITGGGFAAGTTVAFVELPSNNVFGGTPNTKLLTGLSIVNANTMTAVTPSATNAGLVDVVVMSADQQTAFIRNGYTYSNGTAAPSVTAISPNFGPTTGGTAVAITGTGFVNGATVSFNGTPATGVGFVSETTLTATTPVRATGLANVTVTNPNLQTGTLPSGFFYFPPPSASRYHVIAPCRLFDTRTPSGPAAASPVLSPNEIRSFDITGRCGVPDAALSVAVNLTVASPEAAGELRLFPGNGISPNPPTSSISFAVAKTRANNATVVLSTDGTATVKVQNVSTGTVHFILDVSGYFLLAP